MVKTFRDGPFDVRVVISFKDKQNASIDVTKGWELSTSELLIQRFVISWAALNICIALLSLFVLASVVRRRCESFSIFSLLIILVVSLSYAAISVAFVTYKFDRKLMFDADIENDKVIKWSTVSVNRLFILLVASASAMTLWAGFHLLYAFQYLRSALTVPLHFERQIREDSNSNETIPMIDKKISRVTWSIVSA